ncbi:hypothetical protein JCM19992_15620 [Thermostilla marina]
MPIKVKCPLCKTEITVKPDLHGKRLKCPWCHHRFHPGGTKPTAADVPADDAPLAVPPTMASGQKEGDSTPSQPPEADSHDTPTESIPTQIGRKARLKLDALRESKADSRRPSAPPAAQTPASPSSPQPTAPPKRQAAVSTPAEQSAPVTQPTKTADRAGDDASPGAAGPKKKVARLILTEQAESQWKLGSDGDLPNLHLKEDQEQEEKEEKPKQSNPLLLFFLAALSVMASILLLFVDVQPTGSNLSAKDQARRIIAEEYYTNLNPDEPLEPYQVYLREAEWAHSRGDTRTEREMYRRVLRLLFAESDSFRGLTGSRERDKRLEEQIRILLQP